jgi:uncharacterized membrane protein (UPF0127 family)
MSCKFIPITQWNTAIRGNHLVYIANTPCKRKQGLQGLRKMPAAALVLFPDMSPGAYMHTQNCYFPIDIIYLNEKDRVLGKITANPNQQRIGPSPLGTSKILEAPGGWCKHNCINNGDSLQLYSSTDMGW